MQQERGFESFLGRIPIHEKHVVVQIFDPDLRNTNSRIARQFDVLVISQSGIGDFDEEKNIMSTIINDETIDHYETLRLKKSGEDVYVSLTVSPLLEVNNIIEKVLGEKLRLNIYRIVQEQLNNTFKYSGAENVYISLEQTTDSLKLLIKDDGVGFDTTKFTKGVGLQNIDTRAEIHNGKMALESKPGAGCMLTVTFPL